MVSAQKLFISQVVLAFTLRSCVWSVCCGWEVANMSATIAGELDQVSESRWRENVGDRVMTNCDKLIHCRAP